MKRRDFIKGGIVSVAALSLPSLAGCGSGGGEFLAYDGYVGVEVRLLISGALARMVDGQSVFMWAFTDLNQTDPSLQGPRVPGPVIDVEEGYPLRFTITNTADEVHGFAIPGVVDMGVIAPGQTKVQIVNSAPAAGTYMYFDPLNSPVNRVLGLHGAMVVRPSEGATTPYSSPTANISRLFNDLGTSAEFPGEPWRADPHLNRSRIWMFNSIDPFYNSLAQNGKPIDPAGFASRFLPRYFTINGRSGTFSSHDAEDIVPFGRIGQPHLIRILNAGMATHSPHLHANHFYVLAMNNVLRENVVLLDTFGLKPLDRVDWLVPFQRPPDIPGDRSAPLRALLANELKMVLGDVPQSPLEWPMHCHMEMSQTAAGGNYPQGMVTHWELTGDLDGVEFPLPEGM
jgi:FtsP/CotA-like multicopper oxidase with cupredoxin domain